MNNLPLQPLVWFEREDGNMYGNIKHCAQGAGIFYTIMPTWIDASERLPEEDGLYLVLRKGFTFEMGNASDLVPKVSGWNGGRGCFDDDYGNVLITHWMPIPEFSTVEYKGAVEAFKVDDVLSITSSEVILANGDLLECNHTSVNLPHDDAIRLRDYLNRAYPISEADNN